MEGGFALGRREGDLIRRLLGQISLLCNRLAEMCVNCVCVCARVRVRRIISREQTGKMGKERRIDR